MDAKLFMKIMHGIGLPGVGAAQGVIAAHS
jgi:hypothetical protein